MNKKKLIVPLILILAGAAVYFVFFFKDKALKFIPKDVDAVVLIDVKKLTGQYISNLITHPSRWSGSKKKDKTTVSLKDSGIRIPDFLQVFHLKDTRFSEWYTVVELKDVKKFSAYLKSHQFVRKGENIFRKDQVFIKIEGEKCILGTSASAFDKISRFLLHSSGNRTMNADQLIDQSLGSLSFISGGNIQSFSIDLKKDGIEIKNTAESQNLASLAAKLQQKNFFLEAELNAENIRNYTSFFSKGIRDSAQITYFKASADLEQVNDTIISYEYDDNFNEVEKKTYQKIIQPNYVMELQTSDPEKAWSYFQHKKWINSQDQFTAIPFQPNHVVKNSQGLTIQSTRNPLPLSRKENENYILIRNHPLLLNSLSTLSPAEKKMLSDVDYIYYGNKNRNYWVKIKVKEDPLPLILRW